MVITAQLVKELREKTGAGMMDCKKALQETDGELENAIEYLRKKGLQALSKKISRIASDGVVFIASSQDQKTAVLLEVNCETDFVAKNEDFSLFASEMANLVLIKEIDSVDELLGFTTDTGEKSEDKLNTLVSRIGEKLSIRRFVRAKAQDSESLGTYIHLGNKIGVIVILRGTKIEKSVLKDIAMHVAAAHPLYLNSRDIPQDVLKKEREIYSEQLKDTGKPPQVLEKIIDGKVSKFAKEVCLNEQIFVKDPTGKKSVSSMLKEIDPNLAVVSFTRYQVGEGIEKKKDDFASEVAQMVG